MARRNPFLTDPGYLAALAAEQAGSQQADASLRAAQEQALVQFGAPELAQIGGFNVSPLTAAMAQQNTQAGNSTLAALQQTRDQNQQAIIDNLAARGMIYSGGLGALTSRNQQAYGRDVYSAEQQALAGVNQAQAQNVATKQGLRSDTTKALTSAYDTYVQNPGLWSALQPVDDGGVKAAANALATIPSDAASSLRRPGSPPRVGPAPMRFQVTRNAA